MKIVEGGCAGDQYRRWWKDPGVESGPEERETQTSGWVSTVQAVSTLICHIYSLFDQKRENICRRLSWWCVCVCLSVCLSVYLSVCVFTGISDRDRGAKNNNDNEINIYIKIKYKVYARVGHVFSIEKLWFVYVNVCAITTPPPPHPCVKSKTLPWLVH